MRIKYLLIGLFASALSGIGSPVFAEITVNQAEGVLTIISSVGGTVTAKVVAPDDEIVINQQYDGSMFSWTPSGMDDAYRYDVRIIPDQTDASANTKGNYAGGVIEVKNGQMIMTRGQ